MKKISRRALALILLTVLVLAASGLYIQRFLTEGGKWATSFSSSLNGTGTLYDRYGALLACYDETSAVYSADELTRKACYHITGDYWGRTGTGMLNRMLSSDARFDIVTGTTVSEDHSMMLTIDSEMCKAAYDALAERKGAVMVINYKTGEIPCMVSYPSIDPLENESDPPDGAYINRCISAAFTPGSCFKLVTSAAAIESIPDLSDRSFWCEHEYDIAGVTITCAGTHYTQTFSQALSNSCNCAFAQISVKVGQNSMVEHVRRYGFLDSLDIDGIPTAAGTYPLDFVGDPELAWSGIGQSIDTVTPFAMVRYVSALANYGTLVTPHLIYSPDAAETQQLVDADTAARVRDLMKNNVLSSYAPDTRFPGLDLGAKTGTAELGDGTSNAWFVGFLDDEAYPYAFVVMLERGGSGLTYAGATANELLQWIVSHR